MILVQEGDRQRLQSVRSKPMYEVCSGTIAAMLERLFFLNSSNVDCKILAFNGR